MTFFNHFFYFYFHPIFASISVIVFAFSIFYISYS